MLTFLRIERPTMATLRPTSTATSAACCMRCTFEANEATRTRPVSTGMIWRNASPTSRSEPVTPGALGVRRVPEQEVDPARAELGEPADIGSQAVDRRVVDLVVAGVEDAAAGRVEHDRDGVRDRVRDADELDAKRPELDGAAFGIGLPELGGAQEAVLVELRLDEAERQTGRPDLLHADLARARTAGRPRGPRARA